MRLLSKYILLIALFYSTQLSARNSIHSNLSYFFQDADMDLSVLKLYEIDIEAFVRSLHQFDQDPKKKRIDHITKEIEKKYFKLYKNEADMVDFFVSGHHNSICATAIQSIILTELDIPYQIAENGDWLTLIAYPENESIVVEYSGEQTLLPWTEKSQTQAVNYLIDMEVVTMSQANVYGYALIDNYFSSKNNISLRELAGLDLMKKGILAIEFHEYLRAAELLSIGHENYLDIRFTYLLYGAMEFAIEDMPYDKILIIDYMLRLYNLNQKQAALDRLKSNLNHVYHIALNERRDFEFIDSAKSLAKVNLKDSADQNLILSDFFKLDMFYYYNKQDDDKAFECGKMGLKYNPNNLELQDLFSAMLIENLLNNMDLSYSESEQITMTMDSLNYYINEYPFLAQAENIKKFIILMKCARISEAFNANKLEKGMLFLAELDQTLIAIDQEDADLKNLIADAYSDVATYYYRQKKYELAMEWIEKAIVLSPGSALIKQRKKNIEAKR